MDATRLAATPYLSKYPSAIRSHPKPSEAIRSHHQDEWVVGDGRALPFEEGSFDLCFSNSVIEHVGGLEDQRRFAEEIRRVGRGYYVQTPDPSFPIEPHFIAPLIHWFPPAQRKHLARLTPWALLTRPSHQQIAEFVDSIRLISKKEFSAMFPDAEIVSERVLGLSKSLIAYRKIPSRSHSI